MSTGRLGAGDTAIQPTLLDAKGDLVTAVAADTPARLAVGNNGETLVADSGTATGLRWQGNYAAGKNKIINGDFGIWQRGTSFSNPNFAYTADRWFITADGSGATWTISQQTFTPGSAPVAGYEGATFLRWNRSVAGSGGSYASLVTRLEDVRLFAGQTVTLSFWAKADASRTVVPYVGQNFGSGGSAYVTTMGSGIGLSTSWTRYSQTFTVPSISGKTVGTSSYLEIFWTLPLNTTMTIDFWGVQLEAGNVATPFQTATGTLQGELAACQRYYYRNSATGAYDRFSAPCGGTDATTALPVLPVPVTMRVGPTSIEYSNLALYDGVGVIALSNLVIDANTRNFVTVRATSTGLTQYRPYLLIGNNSASAYIAFGAEL